MRTHPREVLLVALAAALAGCGKPAAPARTHAARPVATNTAPAAPPASAGTVDEPSRPRGANIEAVASNTAAYVVSADAAARLERALAFRSTNEFTFETISNLVADIPSQVLLDRVVPLYRNANVTDPRTMAIMHIFEVIMLRGAPPAAALFARHMVGGFYCYNSSEFPERGETWGMAVLDGAALRPDAGRTERSTYASILYEAMQRSKRNEECLRRIANLEKLVKDGVIPMDKQPYEMLSIFKATSLIRLGRDDEAMAVLRDLYERRDQLDSTVRMLVEPGPETHFNNMRYGTTDPKMIEEIKARRAARHNQ